jgi:hypothetical protein
MANLLLSSSVEEEVARRRSRHGFLQKQSVVLRPSAAASGQSRLKTGAVHAPPLEITLRDIKQVTQNVITEVLLLPFSLTPVFLLC